MGKKSAPKPPAPPDPAKVAQAQTGSNIGTAIANAYIGNANEYGPYGSVIYNPTGHQNISIDGKSYQVPQFERVNVLDPAEQGMLDQQRLLGHGLNNMAINQTGRLNDLLSSPVVAGDLPNQVNQVPTAPQFTGSVEGPGLYGLGNQDWSEDRKRVEEALYSRLNPQLERDRSSLENTLMNQGYVRGTQAFDTAMDEHTRQANDARMQAVLAGGQEQSRLSGLDMARTGFNNEQAQQMWANAMAGNEMDNSLRQLNFGNQTNQVDMQNQLRERALQEQLALRNQPINEITALMSGGQVNVPQFSPFNAPQVGQVPVGQYMYNSARMDQNNWAQQQQARSQMMGGLFGLGGMAAHALLGSDRRLKTAIKRLGVKVANGLNLYSFRYLWDSEATERVGLMSDEVRQVRPEAVVALGGYDTVDYTLAMAG